MGQTPYFGKFGPKIWEILTVLFRKLAIWRVQTCLLAIPL